MGVAMPWAWRSGIFMIFSKTAGFSLQLLPLRVLELAELHRDPPAFSGYGPRVVSRSTLAPPLAPGPRGTMASVPGTTNSRCRGASDRMTGVSRSARVRRRGARPASGRRGRRGTAVDPARRPDRILRRGLQATRRGGRPTGAARWDERRPRRRPRQAARPGPGPLGGPARRGPLSHRRDGVFGCWLLESLLAANDRLGLGTRATVLTRDPVRFRKKAPHLADHPSVSLLRGDVRSSSCKSGSFPYVVHAATEVFPVLEDTTPIGKRRRSSTGRATFSTSPSAAGPGGSSSSARAPSTARNGRSLGDRGGRRASSSGPQGFRLRRGQAAGRAECLGAKTATGLAVVIARSFAFVGPTSRSRGTTPSATSSGTPSGAGPVVVRGDGTPVRSYLYASDLAAWLWTILLRGTPPAHTTSARRRP